MASEVGGTEMMSAAAGDKGCRKGFSTAMNGDRIYFDWNAGAPLKAVARERLVDCLCRVGNGSSVHGEGRRARAEVEAARRAVAALVGAEARAVTFVSGGTEAANAVLTPHWTLFGRPCRVDRLLVSAVEHPAVRRGGRFSSKAVEALPVDGDGIVDLGALETRLAALAAEGQRALVSVMLANNETGVVEPVAEVARLAHAHGAIVHTDAVQAAGRMPVDIGALGVDALTLSAHKIGGAQGAGAVVRGAAGLTFAPLVTGGGQEQGLRAGTENVAAIAAFGAAAEVAGEDIARAGVIAGYRDRIAAIVRARTPQAVIFAEGAKRLANTLAFAVPGIASQTALIAFDLAGVALSSGSACASGKVAASHVLAAMGVDAALRPSGLRISIGPDTTDDEIERFGLIYDKVLDAMTKRHGIRAA